jgi:hypothetical protein
MAPKTVQQLFGLKPEEVNALTVLSGLEGYRGGRGEDVAATAANVLARRLHGGWGGRDIRNIATAPGQYEAIYGRNINMNQLADPAFGAKILGSQDEFNRLRNIVNDPTLVGQQFQRSKGAMSFRGTAGYANRKPGDYTPIPGKSNFYFDSDPNVLKQGMGIFGSAAAMQPPAAIPLPPAAVSAPPTPAAALPSVSSILSGFGVPSPKTENKKDVAKDFALGMIRNLIPNLFGMTP